MTPLQHIHSLLLPLCLCLHAVLRLQILDPCDYPDLVRALYGLLMLLPQSGAFSCLQQRLSCVPALSVVQGHQNKRYTECLPVSRRRGLVG